MCASTYFVEGSGYAPPTCSYVANNRLKGPETRKMYWEQIFWACQHSPLFYCLGVLLVPSVDDAAVGLQGAVQWNKSYNTQLCKRWHTDWKYTSEGLTTLLYSRKITKQSMHQTATILLPRPQHACELLVPDIWDEDEQLKICLHSEPWHQETTRLQINQQKMCTRPVSNLFAFVANLQPETQYREAVPLIQLQDQTQQDLTVMFSESLAKMKFSWVHWLLKC